MMAQSMVRRADPIPWPGMGFLPIVAGVASAVPAITGAVSAFMPEGADEARPTRELGGLLASVQNNTLSARQMQILRTGLTPSGRSWAAGDDPTTRGIERGSPGELQQARALAVQKGLLTVAEITDAAAPITGMPVTVADVRTAGIAGLGGNTVLIIGAAVLGYFLLTGKKKR